MRDGSGEDKRGVVYEQNLNAEWRRGIVDDVLGHCMQCNDYSSFILSPFPFEWIALFHSAFQFSIFVVIVLVHCVTLIRFHLTKKEKYVKYVEEMRLKQYAPMRRKQRQRTARQPWIGIIRRKTQILDKGRGLNSACTRIPYISSLFIDTIYV